jgi:uncharacterized protein (DUF4415 family)
MRWFSPAAPEHTASSASGRPIAVNKQSTKPELDDGDAPELTPELARQAKRIDEIPEFADFAEFVRKGGRPRLPASARKRRVTIMLDPDVVEHFKAGGRGWHTRMNAALRKAAGL